LKIPDEYGETEKWFEFSDFSERMSDFSAENKYEDEFEDDDFNMRDEEATKILLEEEMEYWNRNL